MSIESIQPHLDPVRKSVVVARSPAEAFEIFTARIGTWWPVSRFSIHGERTASCTIEPRVGGRVYETSVDGEVGPWGTVLAWEPPHRLVLEWYPGNEPATPTEVEVRFTAVPDGTLVELEHRNWIKLGTRGAEARGNYQGGWAYVFEECFAKACA